MSPGSIPWLDWTPEAFARAGRESRPILLSLGAAWDLACREMNESTYSDPDVIRTVVEGFVPIRVDSERRPDIHARYHMDALPTTIFLTPEGRIVAGATFLSPHDMRRVLRQVGDLFRDHRPRLYAQIREREDRIRQIQNAEYEKIGNVNASILQNTLRGIAGSFDSVHGGFGAGPKFPHAESLRLLIDAFLDTGGNDFATMCRKTLDAVCQRGLFDPVEGGFFRYAVQPTWAQPHTEKLLEDNARLVEVLLASGRLWGEMDYENRAERTVQYLLRTLYDPARGLFRGSQSGDEAHYALDADRARAAPPPVDGTAFVDGNAVTARALLFAASALDRADLSDVALKLLGRLWERAYDAEKGVPHYFEGDQPRHFVQPQDPVEILDSLVTAYEYTGDRDWIGRAAELAGFIRRRFYAEKFRGLTDRAPEENAVGELAAPRRADRETGLYAAALLRLAEIEGRAEWKEQAGDLLLGFPDYKMDHGHGTLPLARAADVWVNGFEVIALVGERSDPLYPVFRDAAFSTPRPRRLILHVDPERQPDLRARLPELPEELPVVFVGRRGAWEGPLARPEEVIRHLAPEDEEAPA